MLDSPTGGQVPQLLDAKDLARILRMDRSKTYAVMHTMRTIRRGKRILVRPQDLEDWLDHQAHDPESAA